MATRTPRPHDEIVRALEVQRFAIAASAKAYDEGNKWEAIRLATAVYNILHDHGSIQSLATQLKIRAKLRFFASGTPYDSRNLVRHTPLVMLRARGDGTGDIVPLLNDGPPIVGRRLQFSHWWDKDIILADGAFVLTRKRLVFILRNQEGGGHFSPEMNDQNFLRFSKEQITTPFLITSNSPPVPLLGLELASMRQIAWELIKTLDDQGAIE